MEHEPRKSAVKLFECMPAAYAPEMRNAKNYLVHVISIAGADPLAALLHRAVSRCRDKKAALKYLKSPTCIVNFRIN